MTDAPPSRYKVEERDGRLVVIDNGEPVETLVQHSHPVMTPGKRRKNDKRHNLQNSAQSSPISKGWAHGFALKLADGETDSGGNPILSVPNKSGNGHTDIALGKKGVQRISTSLIGLILAVPFILFLLPAFWFVFIIAAVFAFSGSKENGGSFFQRIRGAWLRWITEK